MEDVGLLLLLLELDDDFEVISMILCELFHAGYFKQTVSRYLPHEFRHHFQMTKRTFQTQLPREINRLQQEPLAVFRLQTFKLSRQH